MMIALGMAHLWNGHPDKAMGQLERAFATNPYAPDVFKLYLSLAYFFNGRPGEGLKILSSSESGVPIARAYRILNLVGLNDIAEAKNEVQILLDENPASILGRMPNLEAFRRVEDRERITAALCLAGLPE